LLVKKPRILILGPAIKPTGYARVAEGMLSPIRDRFEFHQFAPNFRGPATFRYWPIYPNEIRGDPYGLAQLPALIARIDPQLLIIVFDIYLYYVHKTQLEQLCPRLPVILYCPIDGDDADPSFLKGLGGLARLVLFTRFAQTVIEAALRTLPERATVPVTSIIPHGNDTAVFRPCVSTAAGEPDIVESRRVARAQLFPGRADLQDAFIVLNANQNNARKRIDLTLQGFACFAQDKPPDVKLYLHMDLYERGCELLPLARQLGIADRLLLTADGRGSCMSSDQEMNLIYNSCDVGLNTSLGEGWGLVAFEHAATGAAQILPRNSVHEELWAGSADLVETAQTPRKRFDFVTYRAVAHEGVANALERLYRDRDLLRSRSLDAFRHAVSPGFSWGCAAQKWEQMFDDLLN
jgi:glycosyltransferase involved in cell wall biosynthesis